MCLPRWRLTNEAFYEISLCSCFSSEGMSASFATETLSRLSVSGSEIRPCIRGQPSLGSSEKLACCQLVATSTHFHSFLNITLRSQHHVLFHTTDCFENPAEAPS